MPSTTVNATLQGKVYFSLIGSPLVSWVNEVRPATTGTAANTYTTQIQVGNAIDVYLVTSRLNQAGFCSRVFLFFDNLDTAIGVGSTITAATLKVYNNSSGDTTNTITVEGSAWGGDGTTTTLSTSDYSNLDHTTAYSNELTSWAGSGYNSFTLNATAISDMNTNGYLNCVVIEADHDYGNTNPTLDAAAKNVDVGFNYSGNEIQLELTYSTGYGNKVIGVDKTNIGEVTGVATTDIKAVIGIT